MAEHKLEFLESGAPRGERRWWHVVLNGVTIYEHTNRTQVAQLHERLQRALGVGACDTAAYCASVRRCTRADSDRSLKCAVVPGVATAAPAQPLTVWFGPMPESNGRTNWTAILHRGDMSEGHTIDRSQYPGRVRYAADRVRWLLGELEKKPFILDYDGDERTPCHLCGGSGEKDGKPCWGLNFDGTVHDAAPGVGACERHPLHTKPCERCAMVEEERQNAAGVPPVAPTDPDAERYRFLFSCNDFCRDPLWPVVEWMRDGQEHDKATIDAAIDAARCVALPQGSQQK